MAFPPSTSTCTVRQFVCEDGAFVRRLTCAEVARFDTANRDPETLDFLGKSFAETYDEACAKLYKDRIL